MDLNDLNFQQRKAVLETLEPGGSAAVVAGAGSGKTKLLITRIGYIIEDMEVCPENIMAITFTNKAAGELVNRLSSITPEVRKMWVGTFHGVCVRILKKFGDSLGIEKFTIMDSKDAVKVLKAAMIELNITLEKSVIANYANRISNCKSNMLNPTKMFNTAKNEGELQFARTYERYQKLTWKKKTFDFDDLIVYTVTLLKKFPEVKQWFWDNISYVSVDEVQDTNIAQFDLIKLLAGENNLFIVGDDDQSIYSWRCAKPEYLLNFQSLYPNAKMFKLERNYRSTQNIVDASSQLIENNTIRHKKTCFSRQVIGDPILYHVSSDATDEGNWIASEISLINGQGIDFKDIVILYRTNKQSRAIEEAFLNLGIPHKLVGK